VLTGRQAWELFDIIGGSSTGACMAASIGLHHFSMDQCDYLYKDIARFVCPPPLPCALCTGEILMVERGKVFAQGTPWQKLYTVLSNMDIRALSRHAPRRSAAKSLVSCVSGRQIFDRRVRAPASAVRGQRADDRPFDG
jgi:hypothetical protein